MEFCKKLYLFENFSPYIELLTPVLDKIELGLLHSYTSELTIAEALAIPILTVRAKPSSARK